MPKFSVNTGYKQGTPGMSTIFFAPVDQITAQPEPTTTYGAAGATAETTGTWTFATDPDFTTNGFINLKNDLLKGSQITFGNEGDLASPSQVAKVMGRVIGLDSELVERFRDMAGVPGVYAVKTPKCNDNEYWIVGCSCAPGFMKSNGDTDELGGSKGKAIAIEITANCSIYKWTGTLPIKAD